jgi:hypothetical protein
MGVELLMSLWLFVAGENDSRDGCRAASQDFDAFPWSNFKTVKSLLLFLKWGIWSLPLSSVIFV